MIARSTSQPVRARRAEAVLFAALGTAALLCFVFAGSATLRRTQPPAAPAQALYAQPPVPGQQIAAYPPRWHADLRTAYHAAVYLLDPTA